MRYYEVWVASQRYHSENPLTYSNEANIKLGTVVIVSLQRKKAVAIVVKQTKKPSFDTKQVLRIVSKTPLPAQTLELILWLKDYYPAPFGQIVSTIVPSNLVARSRTMPEKSKIIKISDINLSPLTKEQKDALGIIRAKNPVSVLLHGDTGTGKTRVYIERTIESINQGRSVLLLTPEIGLTPQLALTCKSIFPNQTVVLHSRMSAVSRRNIWLQILESKEPLIIVGPRSVLFAPAKNVGLVVIDEFHEPSYKQEQAPHYQASRVGAKLAELHNAQLILGSATPTVSDYFVFREKELPIIRMRQQALNQDFGEPKKIIIDLKNRKLFNRSTWLSETLIDAMKTALKNHQQSLIFLNRRGTARVVICQSCGWQPKCPNCDLPLTYHGDNHSFRCHTCGFAQKSFPNCPNCQSSDILFSSIGTKSIVTEIERLFPGAKIARFDSDTHKSLSLERRYDSIKDGSIDILVGTQMLGKGLDLPKLSVMGIVSADTSLFFPDYTSEERTFQLITQATGRVHRGHLAGTAIIQSYNPSSALIKSAINKDFESLYELQISERKLYKFPPFRYLLKLSCSRINSLSAKQACEKLRSNLVNLYPSIEIDEPCPSFIEKSNGKFHWQLVIRAKRRQVLSDIIRQLPSSWIYDIDPMNLL